MCVSSLMLTIPLCLIIYPHAIWLSNFYHKEEKVSSPTDSTVNICVCAWSYTRALHNTLDIFLLFSKMLIGTLQHESFTRLVQLKVRYSCAEAGLMQQTTRKKIGF